MELKEIDFSDDLEFNDEMTIMINEMVATIDRDDALDIVHHLKIMYEIDLKHEV